MSTAHTIKIPAHNSIYTPNYEQNNYKKRELTAYYSLPDAGVRPDTGVVLFIAGFGGHANSNVYKKMRAQFADTYNLVTIQCDYFGWEFMQGNDSTVLSAELVDTLLQRLSLAEVQALANDKPRFYAYLQKEDLQLTLECVMNESLDNFCDMSYMQAIDNITAVLHVIQGLADEGLHVNAQKIMLFGQSQGAYLSYFCHALTRNLFTHILDNSTWLYPSYIHNYRVFITDEGEKRFRYITTKIPFNQEYLHLSNLTRGYTSPCRILAYHGSTDNFHPFAEKQTVLGGGGSIDLRLITEADVPTEIFKDTSHGLGADFLALFGSFHKDFVGETAVNPSIKLYKRPHVRTPGIDIDYKSGVPVVTAFRGLSMNT